MKINIKKATVCTLMLLSLIMPINALAFNFDVGVKIEKRPGISSEDDSLKVLKGVTDGSGLQDFKNSRGRGVVEEGGLSGITGALKRVINIIKWALGGVAVLTLFYSAFRLVTAADQADDIYNSAKNQLTYLLIGLFLVFATDIFIQQVFVVSDGNFLGSVEEARRFATIGTLEIEGIYGFFQLFLGVISVLMIVYYGVRMVANSGSDEPLENAKSGITWGVAGIILVGLSELIIKDILFVDQGAGFDLNAAKKILVTLTNFASGFIATAAVAMSVYAGYLYIFSAVGDDNTDKVKSIITNAIIGILIAGGAFALVNTLVQFEEPDLPELLQDTVENGLGQ